MKKALKIFFVTALTVFALMSAGFAYVVHTAYGNYVTTGATCENSDNKICLETTSTDLFPNE